MYNISIFYLWIRFLHLHSYSVLHKNPTLLIEFLFFWDFCFYFSNSNLPYANLRHAFKNNSFSPKSFPEKNWFSRLHASSKQMLGFQIFSKRGNKKETKSSKTKFLKRRRCEFYVHIFKIQQQNSYKKCQSTRNEYEQKERNTTESENLTCTDIQTDQ